MRYHVVDCLRTEYHTIPYHTIPYLMVGPHLSTTPGVSMTMRFTYRYRDAGNVFRIVTRIVTQCLWTGEVIL